MGEDNLEEKRVCGSCIGNPFLRRSISEAEALTVACAFCEQRAPIISLDELANIFDNEFQENYQIADNFLREDRGYPLLGDELNVIIRREVEPKREALIDDLSEVVQANWKRYKYYDQASDEENLFIRTGVADNWFHRRWHEMQESLRKRARFVNPDALKVLQAVFDKVGSDATSSGKPLIMEIIPGHELATLFRARVFQNDDALVRALENPDSHLGPPPSGVGSAGRMNARGISMFYGANSAEVAIAEVRPPVGSRVAIAEFKVIRPIRVLDLTRLSQIPSVINRSMFDTASLDSARRQKFLSQLERVLTKPILPEHSEDGYLLTQVISDYLATHEKLNLDGLVFRSAQVSLSGNKDPLNVALFNKASTVRNVIKKSGSHLSARLYETDDDGNEYFHPQVLYKDGVDDGFNLSHDDEATLEINLGSMVIFDIKGVNYSVIKREVELNAVSDRK